MAVKLPDTLVPMADFPSAFAKDVQFTDGENLQDKLDKGKLGSSSSGTGLTEEQANNIEKIPSIEGIVTSNSQAITNKADKDHEHTEYLKEIPDEYVTDTELSSKGYATETFVTSKIAEASLSGGDVDLSGYATKDDIPTKTSELTNDSGFITAIPDIYALKTDIPTMPTNTSQLTNDSGFITTIPEEYITETELEDKGYLTEHQSLTDYAKKTDIPDVSDFLTEVPEGYVTDTELSTELDNKVNKEVGKGLSTNDLTNELVTKINSSATEAFVTNAIANAQLGDKEVDLSGYATVDALNLKADLTHTHDQYLTEVPDEYITETELTDKNYADKEYVTQAVSNVKVDLTEYAKTSDIPTKVSQLTNDSNFITTIPEEYITETELANELSTRNVKTYTNITQLGLTAPVITGKIYNALPENSIFQCEITDNKTVSDTPEATGILTIQKSSKRLAIEFKACARYSVYPNNLYLGQLKGDDGSGITWNKVALYSDLEGISGGGGIAPNITIGTVSSGTEASANITGSTPNLVLNLTIPKGDKGDTGANGKDGTFDATTLFNSLETTDKTVIGAINEVKDMADLILDTGVRIDKTYSSSKIYTDIQQCLEDSKTYTLEEIAKFSGSSYEVVTSTSEMTSESIIYLLPNGSTYDMYIVEKDGVTTKIGDMNVNLSQYVKATDLENDYLKKADADGKYATIVTIDGKVDKDKIVTVLGNTVTDKQVASAKAVVDELDKKANGDEVVKKTDITTTIDSSSTDDKVPSAKAVNDGLGELENITRLMDFDEAIPEKGKNKIYYVNKLLGTYKCAQWRVESMYYDVSGAKQYRGVQIATSINGVDNIMLMREYYLDDNNVVRWGAWKGFATVDNAKDVGVTTITPVNSAITGTIEYTVKNGICYVSLINVKSTTNSNGLSISTTMPKPAINSRSAIVKQVGNGNIGIIYIGKNTTQLTANIYISDIIGDCSFSYPVAE